MTESEAIKLLKDASRNREIHVGSRVNIEFDILGKYIARLQQLK